MANWSTLKAAINSAIKTNGNQAITGQVLQNTLNNIISSIGENYQFVDIATPATNPGAPDGNVFYIAYTAGTYVNFSNITVNSNEVVFLLWKGTWTKKIIGLATAKELNALNTALNQTKANIFYAVCGTGSSTVGKVVTMANFVLSINTRFVVKMTYTNTAASPTLNINKTGAKPIYYNGKVASADNSWDNGEVLDIYYDGTNYQAFSIKGSNESENIVMYKDYETEIGTYNSGGGIAVNNKAVRLEINNPGISQCHAYVLGDTKPIQHKILVRTGNNWKENPTNKIPDAFIQFKETTKAVKIVFYFEEDVITPPLVRLDIYGEYIMPNLTLPNIYSYANETAYIDYVGVQNNVIIPDDSSAKIIHSSDAKARASETIELIDGACEIEYNLLKTNYKVAFLFSYASGNPYVRFGYYTGEGTVTIPNGAKYMIIILASDDTTAWDSLEPYDVLNSVNIKLKAGLAAIGISQNINRYLQRKINAITKLRIMSWNIGHFSNGTSSSSTITDSNVDEKRKKYRECFNRISADIVCLCEYDNIFNTSNSSNTYDEILNCYKYTAIGTKHEYNMNAIFSRIPLSSQNEYVFPNKSQYRYIKEATINIGGNNVIIAVTHLDFISEDLNKKQINEIISRYNDNDYVIVAGDFNTSKSIGGSSLFDAFLESGYTLLNHGYMGDIITYLTGNKDEVLDNILVKGLSMGNISSEDINDLSDHSLIYCDLMLSS